MCKKCGEPLEGADYCLPCELEAVYQHNQAHSQIRAEIEAKA